MKLDPDHSFIRLCPETNRQLTERQYAYSWGVCPHCGWVEKGTFTHATTIPGKWVRPSIWEWIMGKRKYFQEGIFRDNG